MSAALKSGLRSERRSEQRDRIALTCARAGAAAVLIGSFALPTLANLGAVAMLVGLASAPSAAPRLRAALREPLAQTAIALLAVFALSMLWSQAPWSQRLQGWFNWRPMILLIVGLALFDTAADRVRVLVAFIIAATAGALWSYAAWALGFSTVVHDHGLPGIVWRNPVTQAMAFALATFFALMLAATGQVGRRARAAFIAAALLLAANLAFVTSGRSGHLLLLILLAVAAWLKLRGTPRLLALVAVPLAALLVFAASPMVQTRFKLMLQELRQPEAATPMAAMAIRAVIWRTSAAMVAERPLLGFGMGGFRPAYAQRVAQQQSGWRATPSKDPHNQFLSVQLHAGIPGTLAFLAFVLAALRSRAPMPFQAWGRAVLIGWCATSLASSHFETMNEGHMIGVLLGLLLARGEPQEV